MKDVLLWVRCYQIGLHATEKYLRKEESTNVSNFTILIFKNCHNHSSLQHPTRGSLTSPSYLVRNRTRGPPLENHPETPPSSRTVVDAVNDVEYGFTKQDQKEPCMVNLSIGSAKGEPQSYDELFDLISEADAELYKVKIRTHSPENGGHERRQTR